MTPQDSTILVTIKSREFQESESDPDFDPSVMSEMSAVLKDKLEANQFKIDQDEVPVERFVPEKSKKCRSFWEKICCCCSKAEEDGDDGGDEDSIDESSMYFVAARSASGTSADPYVAGTPVPGVRASMNIHSNERTQKIN